MELFKATAPGRRAQKHIVESDDAFTPSLVLAELAWKYFREGVNLPTIRTWLRSISEATQVVEIDATLAEESARATKELLEKAQKERLAKPGLGDGLILATARICEARLLTGDPHFRGLAETVWLE